MPGGSSRDERSRTIILLKKNLLNLHPLRSGLILFKFSGRFSSLRKRSLGDSGESLVVHFKKPFWRLCSASRLLFFLCFIHFPPLFGPWLVPYVAAETLQWFLAPWSSICSSTLSAQDTFPQGNLPRTTLDLFPTGRSLCMFFFSRNHSAANQDS